MQYNKTCSKTVLMTANKMNDIWNLNSCKSILCLCLQFCSMLGEDPLSCDRNGLSLSKGKRLSAFKTFKDPYPGALHLTLLSLFFRGLHWMPFAPLWSCLLPAPHVYRSSVVKQHPRTLRPARWTTSYWPSRSSSALMTSPKLPSSWWPSPPGRKNSDPPNTSGSSGQGIID